MWLSALRGRRYQKLQRFYFLCQKCFGIKCGLGVIVEINLGEILPPRQRGDLNLTLSRSAKGMTLFAIFFFAIDMCKQNVIIWLPKSVPKTPKRNLFAKTS
jgi:hypothetical protein